MLGHIYPEFQSAFTYQDHRRPFKIDYAQAMYGGPFSTEQVEDVKNFLGLFVSALVPMGAAVTIVFLHIMHPHSFL